MNAMAMAAPAHQDVRRDTGGNLMTRHQVAVMFRVTSALVAQWARRGRLAEVRDETGRPRYRRADVEDLYRSGFGPGTR
jgi:hypothetical protein